MSIRTLRTFLSVARNGTFAAAAKDVGLTQAAVSMQMKSLENELNSRLFERAGRAVVLNTSGRSLVPTAARIVGLYENMALAVNGSDLGGSLHIGAVPPVFGKLLPDALLNLKRQYPRVEVHVISGMSDALAAKVEAGELDAALVADPPGLLGKGMILHPIAREPLVLIARRRVRVTSAREVLAAQPFIRLARDSWTGRLIDHVLREYAVQVQTVMELDMPDGIAEMVARGFGVSIIPMYDGRWLDDSRLSIWRFNRPQLERGIGLVERRGNARTALTAALLQHLLEVKISTRRTIRLKPISLR